MTKPRRSTARDRAEVEHVLAATREQRDAVRREREAQEQQEQADRRAQGQEQPAE